MMAPLSSTTRKTSRLRRACATQSFRPGKLGRRLVLEHLEGRDLPAPLAIAPTTLETSVGASTGLASFAAIELATIVPASAGVLGPSALAFDSSGDLYVADQNNNTVSKVTPGGTVTTFVPASAGLSVPSSLAFDSSGNLYVSNAGTNTISEVTPAGAVSTFVPASAGLSFPSSLAFNSAGNLFVASPANNKVIEVTPGGAVSTFIPASAGVSSPLGLAFDSSGNLYLIAAGKMVDKVTPAGVITPFVSVGRTGPSDLAFDAAGNLYVANETANTVSVVTPDGTLRPFVSAAAGLFNPIGLAFDSSDSLYVAYNGSSTVSKAVPAAPTYSVSAADAANLSAIGLTLNPNGTFSGTVTSLPPLNSLALTVNASDALGDSGSATIHLTVTQPVINPTSLKTGVGATPGLPPLTVTGQGGVLANVTDTFFRELEGLAIDNDGNLYVGVTDRVHMVYKITPDGAASIFVPEIANLDDPQALTFDSNGNLYVAYSAGQLYKVAPNGALNQLPFDFSNPEALAFDSSGNLYIADAGPGVVYRLNAAENQFSTFVPASAGLSFPDGLAFDSSGNLYVANYGSATVSKVTPSGTVTTFVPASAGLSFPDGLAFDSNGNLYVANRGTNTVSEVAPAGTVNTFIPSPAGLTDASAMAFNSNGSLYIVNEGFGTISKWNLATASFAISAADASKLSAIGLTLHANGAFSGTVTGVPSPNPLTFTVTATDALGDWSTAQINLTVSGPPASAVKALAIRQTSDSFMVPVTFADPLGPGVASVDLYVSTNNGRFSLYQTQPAGGAASGTLNFSFTGQDRNVYAFYSIAHDLGGMKESKSTIEASTYVPDLNPPVTHVLNSSSYANGVFTLHWSGTDPDQNSGTPAGSIVTEVIYVKVDGGAPQLVGQSPAGSPSGGVYSGSMTFNALADGAAHSYGFYSIGTDDQAMIQATPATPDVTFSPITYSAALTAALTVEKGIQERSFIQYLDVNFNQPGSNSALQSLASGLAGSQPGAFVELEYYGTNPTASSSPISAATLFGGGIATTVTLSGSDLSINFGSKGITGTPTTSTGDGWYALGIDPTGNPSNNQVYWLTFFRLLGDANGDRHVTGPTGTAGTDEFIVNSARGQSGTLMNADVNGDGAVNTTDLTEVVKAVNNSVGSTAPQNFPTFQIMAGKPGPGTAAPTTLAQVQALVPGAIAAWQKAGLGAVGVQQLQKAPIEVVDLGGNILGQEVPGLIEINTTAAGYSWNVTGNPAAGQMDLQTVLEHEMGHILGLPDNGQAGDLMGIGLGLGVRRAPSAFDMAMLNQALRTAGAFSAGDTLAAALSVDRSTGRPSSPLQSLGAVASFFAPYELLTALPASPLWNASLATERNGMLTDTALPSAESNTGVRVNAAPNTPNLTGSYVAGDDSLKEGSPDEVVQDPNPELWFPL